MSFEPGYGQTAVSHDEHDALTEQALALLGNPILKADLYDLEQQVQIDVADDLVDQVLSGTVGVSDLLTDHFVRQLHARLYANIWTWGGRHRSRETNIGIPPEHIAVEMRNALDNLRFRWLHSPGVTPRFLGISAHAALVHIHPFADGNGRVTRLLADLVFLAAQDDAPIMTYDWDVDRQAYLRLLRRYDVTGDPSELVDFVPLLELSAEG